ncbi:MAG: hypothetical protein GEU77_09325 [Deltaproteobacteria bacterium]|nr:hypothetical protein [Deltaproteobacteria bacterium]
MANIIGAELPHDLLAALSAGDLASKHNRVVQIVTVGREGWPSTAMLSYTDVVARDEKTLHLATWADGECATDLRQTGRLAVLVIDYDMAYYIRGSAEEVTGVGDDLMDVNQQGAQSSLAFFRIRVEQVLEDRVPTAKVLSGVTFEAADIEEQTHSEVLRRLLNL